MTAGQHIDYEALAQDAMRGVIRSVLGIVAKSGLYGDHHFYIAFNTQAPGVSISKRLKDKYPVEMTIVLQHRFWNLEVSDDKFEVKLTFDGIPERLVVPYRAVKVFYDPSVPYGLQFEESELTAEGARRPASAIESDAPKSDEAGAPIDSGLRPRGPRPTTPSLTPADVTAKRRAPRKPRGDKGDEPRTGGRTLEAVPGSSTSTRRPTLVEDNGNETRTAPAKPVLTEVKSDEQKKPEGGGATIVDLSTFRNKK
jgi:hypothetical protein